MFYFRQTLVIGRDGCYFQEEMYVKFVLFMILDIKVPYL